MEIMKLIEPQFQPIVSYRGHYAYEALMRFRGSSVAPAQQLLRWERSGYIAVIDRAMVRKVTAILAAKPGRYRVAINVSAKTLEVAQAEYLSDLVELHRVAKRVIVEVTETYPIMNTSRVADFAAKCMAMSVHVALDDVKPSHAFCDRDFVGAVKPRFMKLDGQFLDRCHVAGSRGPVREVMRLAESVQAAVIAEWIDSRAKCEYAESLGALLMQGFWIARPGQLGQRNDAEAGTPVLDTA